MGRKSRQKLQKRIDRRLRELSDAQREGFVHHVLTSPLENLSREERAQLFRDLGGEAKQRFYTAFTEVRSQILEFDPLLALSVLSAYGQFGPFGHDSEIHGENMIGQAHVELLQAIMLQRELTSFQHQPLPSSEVFKLHEQVAEMFQAHLQSGWAETDSEASEKEVRRQMLLSLMRSDTQMVRNWAYSHQLRHIVTNLFAALDKDIQKEYGVSVNGLWRMLENIMLRMEDYLSERNERLAPVMREKSLRGVADRYYEMHPSLEGSSKQIVALFRERKDSVQQAKWMVLMHADLSLPEAFTFVLDDFVEAYPDDVEVEALNRVLDRWSLAFGDLASSNPEHLFLENPVWQKPLIKLEKDLYFWPIPGLLNSFGVEILEHLIEQNEKLVKKYQERRGMWLENEVERLFKSAFPEAKVYRGSKWHDPDDQKDYENDLAIKVGGILVVIEAKSGRVHPTARRGAPSRFERVVKDLVVEPSRQSRRFVDYLRKSDGVATFNTAAGCQNVIDVRDVLSYVRLNVTLESLGLTGGRWPELRNAGFIEPNEDVAPTMNVADSSSIFETLDGSCQKLHYLSRRANFERDCIYLGDEIDLLVFYLDTGFDVPSYEEGHMSHMLTSLSKSLDPYLMAQARPDLEVKVDKPKMRLTKWWEDILACFEERKFERWTQAGVMLLDVGFDNQRLLENKFRKIKQDVQRYGVVPDRECAYALKTNQGHRSVAVTAFAYKDLTLEERNDRVRNIAAEVAEKFGSAYTLILGVDVDKETEHYPYSFAALIESEKT